MNIWMSKFVIGNQQSGRQIKIAEEPVIYPVPVKKGENINTGNIMITGYRISTISGNVIDESFSKTPIKTIKTSHMERGTYIIELYDNKARIFTRKVIVK